MAHRQHGIVTRRDLLALGFSPEAIEHRVAKGRLHTVARGVYAVGWPQLTAERRWMTAVLACGKGAALSHRSAAALWGIGRERDSTVDISVPRRYQCRRPGIRARGRSSLGAKDVVMHRQIPVTRPALTLLDLATELDDPALERTVNEADKRDLIDPDALRDSLEDFAGEPGVQALRTLLDRHTFRLSDSGLELLFRPIAAAAGRYHRTPSAQARDHLRDQTHTAAGLTTLRFTHHQVKYEPKHVRSVLKSTVDRLCRAPGR
jgi:hypothetical protein